MKIQGFQPTQNAASYTPSSKVSTPATSAAAAPGTSDVYSGEKRNFIADLSATLDAAKRLRPDDTSSIAYLEKVNNLANSLAAVSG